MTDLVFTHWDDDSGVFLRLQDWERLRTIKAAIEAADTWGRFRQALPPGEFEKLPTWWDNGGEFAYRVGDELLFMSDLDKTEFLEDYGEDNVIAQSDAFKPGQIWGHDDGDYPDWLGAINDLVLPTAFVEEYGHLAWSMVSGEWLQFPIERIDEMTTDLRRGGFSVTVADWPYY